MKKILNKRLESISAFIHNNEKIIDIGCDHGLLGIYLFLNRENIKIISSDINDKPLLQAKNNLIKYNLEDKIELRLGNGLEVMSNDIETIVISGMGGITMMDILSDIKKYPQVKKIILSPNNDFSYVRKKMKSYGFIPLEEKIIFDKGKYYLISMFIPGQNKIDYFFGKLDWNDEDVFAYYQKVYKTNQQILNSLSFGKKIKKINLIKENIKIKRKLKKRK